MFNELIFGKAESMVNSPACQDAQIMVDSQIVSLGQIPRYDLHVPSSNHLTSTIRIRNRTRRNHPGPFRGWEPLWQFMGPIILNISDLKVQVVGKLLVVPWPAI